jgi:hypothetical protein
LASKLYLETNPEFKTLNVLDIFENETFPRNVLEAGILAYWEPFSHEPK